MDLAKTILVFVLFVAVGCHKPERELSHGGGGAAGKSWVISSEYNKLRGTSSPIGPWKSIFFKDGKVDLGVSQAHFQGQCKWKINGSTLEITDDLTTYSYHLITLDKESLAFENDSIEWKFYKDPHPF